MTTPTKHRVTTAAGLVHPRLPLLEACQRAKHEAHQRHLVILVVDNDTDEVCKIVGHNDMAEEAKRILPRVQQRWARPKPDAKAKRGGCDHEWQVASQHEQTIYRCATCQAWGYHTMGATVGRHRDRVIRVFAYTCRGGSRCRKPATHRVRPATVSAAARWEHFCEMHVPAAKDAAE